MVILCTSKWFNGWWYPDIFCILICFWKKHFTYADFAQFSISILFVGYVEVRCFFLWSRIYLTTHMSAYYYWVIMSNWVITQMLKTHRGFQDWYMGDVIKWKHFPRYWPFVRGIHRSPVNYQHKGQWRGALMFSLICVWINDWVNNREAGDLRRYRAHYDVNLWQPTNYSNLTFGSALYNRRPSIYILHIIGQKFKTGVLICSR